MDDLKDCPFCGGKAVYDTNGMEKWVICVVCGAMSHRTLYTGIKGHDFLQIAWNRRVNDESKTMV